jgi:DNA-directed RNA polymerase subunit RPC12/RpoP
MKVKCAKCEESFEIDPEIYEEGDSVECPSCGAELFVARKGKKIAVVESFEEEDSEGWD